MTNMSKEHIATFNTKTMGPAAVYRGYDAALVDTLYSHSYDPGIVRTLGGKDYTKRFHPETFYSWVAKGGGRYLYTAHVAGELAGTVWVGGETFPDEHFPDAPLQPPYTIAFRTGYSSPEGGTYEGQGIAKRLAVAGLVDVIALTRNGGPQGLPPIAEAGVWLDTGTDNTEGQVLYHHLGNTSRGQSPVGFVDVGVYHPPVAAGDEPEESRVGMVLVPATLQRIAAVSGQFITQHAVR